MNKKKKKSGRVNKEKIVNSVYEKFAEKEESKFDLPNTDILFEKLAKSKESSGKKSLTDELQEINDFKSAKDEKVSDEEIKFDSLIKKEKDVDRISLNIHDGKIEPEENQKKTIKIQFVKEEKRPFISRVYSDQIDDKFKINYAFFSVCSKNSVQNIATKKVCEHMGIGLREFEDFSCCGSGILNDIDLDFSLAINARNLAIAKVNDLDIVTIENNCCLNLNKAKSILSESDERRKSINKILGKINLKFDHNIKIRSIAEVYYENGGIVKSKLSKDLHGLNIAPFYGGNYFIPSRYDLGKNYFNPKTIESLILITGASLFDNPGKTKHVFSISSHNDSIVKMVGDVAKHPQGASMIVTPCTFQQTILDRFQKKARKYSRVKPIPVLHISQLLGIAMGMRFNDLGLNKLKISPKRLLKKNGLYN